MLDKFERYPLTFGPTPIEKLDRLSAHLGGDVEIYAKREDCNSGLAFGGNKVRKLEYIVPDAIASGADTLVTIGGVQSNHTRQVAAVAAKIGMKCRLVQPCRQHSVVASDGCRNRTRRRRIRYRYP
jgi:1-aminocyclopropane-1-carboxylate deaminase